MPPFEFSFDLELPGRTAPTALLDDLATHVLEFVGRTEDTAVIVRELRGAVGAGALPGNGLYNVSFVSRDGQLEIAVSSNRGRVWHTTRPLR